MKILDIFKKIQGLIFKLSEILRRLDDLQQAIGRLENRQLAEMSSMSIHSYEFKVSSQNGEDGIIQWLIRSIAIPNPVFVEFGVYNYVESNTRFLLQNNNWSGLVIDGSQKNINYIKSDDIYWRHNLKAECTFLDKDNINNIIINNGLKEDIGLLSIDIDGNDYWVWDKIDCISPRIVICEYNSLFGGHQKVTIPYKKKFNDSEAHFSRLYWGASIGAFSYLAEQKGYSLIGSNTMGNNIFFVRNDVISTLPITTFEKAYVKSKFRISRDSKDVLNFLDFESGLQLIANMPLYEVDKDQYITVKDLVDF